jgi:hypothetical protein
MAPVIVMGSKSHLRVQQPHYLRLRYVFPFFLLADPKVEIYSSAGHGYCLLPSGANFGAPSKLGSRLIKITMGLVTTNIFFLAFAINLEFLDSHNDLSCMVRVFSANINDTTPVCHKALKAFLGLIWVLGYQKLQFLLRCRFLSIF